MMQLRADEQRDSLPSWIGRGGAAETNDTTLKPSLDPHGYFTSAQLLERDPASARSRAVLWRCDGFAWCVRSAWCGAGVYECAERCRGKPYFGNEIFRLFQRWPPSADVPEIGDGTGSSIHACHKRLRPAVASEATSSRGAR